MFPRSFYSLHAKASARNIDNRAIVFVDTQIPNWANIVQKINPQARAFVLNLQTNGIKSITQILTTTMCYEVHIIATGYPSCIYLGSQELSLNTLIQYEDELRAWFDFPVKQTAISSLTPANSWIESLTVVPTISFYGCNVAAGDGGAEFISRLSQITKAKILASRDILRHEVFCDDEEHLNNERI